MIVIKQVDQVEVFANKGGGITIIQTDGQYEATVCIPVEHVEALCMALRRAAADATDDEGEGE